ncbi:hypothetical protein [Patulibacter defluvii]|uniref:hypothetical protein n=1 Tax=Patulibacter defluvii TaxID=3095358 RepID=UPI002A7537A2|nr:hypothetical protein [Patulibacter sp. DM4]
MARAGHGGSPLHDLRWVGIGLAVAIASIVLVQTGCNTGPEHVVRDGRLQLTLREYSVEPRNVKMRAGLVRIEARNAGRLLHRVRIVSDDDKRGNRRSTFWQDRDQPPLRPGASAAPATICLGPGRYRIISALPGDEELGAVADLRVDGPHPACRPLVGQKRPSAADADSGG